MATFTEKAIGFIIDPISEQVVQTLTAFAADKGWLSLQTNHKVISVLKKIGLIELKDDFNRVYLFALAEYGIERQSIGLVSLFAEKEVREAYESDFREKTELLATTLEHHLHTSPKTAIQPNWRRVKVG